MSLEYRVIDFKQAILDFSSKSVMRREFNVKSFIGLVSIESGELIHKARLVDLINSSFDSQDLSVCDVCHFILASSVEAKKEEAYLRYQLGLKIRPKKVKLLQTEVELLNKLLGKAYDKGVIGIIEFGFISTLLSKN